MRSIFCTNCGAKMEYSSQKPKFCSSCGEPMSASSVGSISSFKARNPVKARPTPISEVGEDSTDATEVPHVRNLEYDIDVPQNNIFNLGDILHERQKEE